MRNFSSSCLLPWLPALAYRQLNKGGFFFLPSCHVRIPWSLLFTKARFRWQRVLVCSCNLILHPPCPGSELLHPPKPKCPPANRFSGYWREPSQSTRSLPFTEDKQLLQNPNSFYTELFTPSAGHFQNLCFCPPSQEEKLFKHIIWIKQLLKASWQLVSNPTLLRWILPPKLTDRTAKCCWGAWEEGGARFLNQKSRFSSISWEVVRLWNNHHNLPEVSAASWVWAIFSFL